MKKTTLPFNQYFDYVSLIKKKFTLPYKYQIDPNKININFNIFYLKTKLLHHHNASR